MDLQPRRTSLLAEEGKPCENLQSYQPSWSSVYALVLSCWARKFTMGQAISGCCTDRFGHCTPLDEFCPGAISGQVFKSTAKSSETWWVRFQPPLGLRSSSPAALDVGDMARKLYLMACEATNVRDEASTSQPSNTGRFGQIGRDTKPGFRNQPVAQRSTGLLIS